LDFTYEDKPHDDEALYVSADATTWLVTKGRSDGVRAFSLPAQTWREGKAVAHAAATLSMFPSNPRQWVTDAAISPDGRTVAVRTYQDIYLFAAQAGTGLIDPGKRLTVCDLRGLQERLGEGMDWAATGEGQVLSSEGFAGQISIAECLPPTPPAP
jgi:hypothetical protein